MDTRTLTALQKDVLAAHGIVPACDDEIGLLYEAWHADHGKHVALLAAHCYGALLDVHNGQSVDEALESLARIAKEAADICAMLQIAPMLQPPAPDAQDGLDRLRLLWITCCEHRKLTAVYLSHQDNHGLTPAEARRNLRLWLIENMVPLLEVSEALLRAEDVQSQLDLFYALPTLRQAALTLSPAAKSAVATIPSLAALLATDDDTKKRVAAFQLHLPTFVDSLPV